MHKESTRAKIYEIIHSPEKQDFTKISFGEYGETMFHIAARYNLVEFLDYFHNLEGPSARYLNCRDSYGHTPLHEAARFGSMEYTKQFILDGADIDAVNGFNGTPLNNALRHSQYGTAILLINSGANVNVKNDNGITPLHHCVDAPPELSSVECLELLIRSGADINAEDNWGTTPLDYAVDIGNTQYINILLEHGACIKNTRDRFQTILSDYNFSKEEIEEIKQKIEINEMFYMMKEPDIKT